MIYPSVLNAVVSALAAEAIDNTSKQAWQKLYNSADEDEGGDLATLVGSRGADTIDRTQVDCWVSARLHSALEQKHWDALVAKYSTHKGRKVQAIAALQAQINTPAPKLFLFKASTAWAIPQLKGARPKVAILREQGVNSQIETAFGFDRAGFAAVDVHMSDLIAGRVPVADLELISPVTKSRTTIPFALPSIITRSSISARG